MTTEATLKTTNVILQVGPLTFLGQQKNPGESKNCYSSVQPRALECFFLIIFLFELLGICCWQFKFFNLVLVEPILAMVAWYEYFR